MSNVNNLHWYKCKHEVEINDFATVKSLYQYYNSLVLINVKSNINSV